ncbi:MAG: FecR domain-containing protein [Bacteroidota bacterium]
MANTRLAYLFELFVTQAAAKAEKEELFILMADPENESQVEGLIENTWINYEPRQEVFSSEQSAAMLQKIMEAKQPAKLVTLSPVPAKSMWRRIAAAAAILLVVSTAAYFLFNRGADNDKPSSKNIAKRYKNDVMPGGNRATLTLGNGSTIVLDSAGNGTLAQQGNVQVVKLSNGELAYTVNGVTTSEVFYNTMSTPRGGQYQLTLPDGTKVWLNAASSITYPTAFTGKERRVKITGEAYFEVMPLMLPGREAKMPFKVSVNDGTEIEVLGTHFNINSYSDEALIKTTLLEGSVKVTHGSNSSLLQPGQQAQITKAGNLSMVPGADIEETMAWKNGRFIFKNADIRTIMNQVARWYDVELSYEGNIADIFVAEMARDIPVSKLCMLLEQTERVHFLIEGKKITVMP